MPQHNTDATARRITVNLTPRAWAAKDRMLKRGHNLTDVVNRNLVLGDWIDTQIEGGAELILRRPDGTEIMAVML